MILQQRKLRKFIFKIIRNEKKARLYLLNQNWIKIRKQKERRRKRTLAKLYKARRLRLFNLSKSA
jgi:hypothetical protein